MEASVRLTSVSCWKEEGKEAGSQGAFLLGTAFMWCVCVCACVCVWVSLCVSVRFGMLGGSHQRE